MEIPYSTRIVYSIRSLNNDNIILDISIAKIESLNRKNRL